MRFSGPLYVFQVDAFFCHFVERRKFAEALYGFYYAVGYIIDFSCGVETADAETNRAMRQIVTRTEGLQYIRWFKRRGGACRAARNCDIVDAHQEGFALHVGKTDVQVAGQAMLHGAVDVDLVEFAHDAVAETIAETAQLLGLAGHFFGRDGASFAQADNAGDIQRSGAHAALMAAAIDNGGNLNAGIFSADVQRADALGPVHFVAGDRHEVDIHLVHIDWNLADGLGGVGVEDDAALMTELADFGDGLHDADLVVGSHDGDQNGFVIHGALEILEIDQAVFLHRQVSDAIAVLLETLAGVEHGLVLGDCGDNVIALLAVHLGHAFDGEVVALSGAGSENDFFGGGADQLGDTLAGSFDALFTSPTERVIVAGGVAELLHEKGKHLLQHPRIRGGGGVVIHINGQLHSLRSGVPGDWELLLGDLYFRAHNCSPT